MPAISTASLRTIGVVSALSCALAAGGRVRSGGGEYGGGQGNMAELSGADLSGARVTLEQLAAIQ
jgi:hypothetical protein